MVRLVAPVRMPVCGPGTVLNSSLAWALLDHCRRLGTDEGGLCLGLEQRQMWRVL
jgi:hypothetical protein